MPPYSTQKKVAFIIRTNKRDFGEKARAITSLLDPLFGAKSREGLRQKKRKQIMWLEG